MKKFTKVVSILLIVVLLTGTLSVLVGCDSAEKDKKRAIIYVTALLSGGMYDTETGEAFWDPFTAEDITLMDFLGGDPMVGIQKVLDNDMNTVSSLLGGILDDSEGNLLECLELKADGTPLYPKYQPIPFSSNLRQKYGALNAYTETINSLNSRYSEFYEISVFNYDWRIDNRINSARLDEYIKANEYDEVILMSHSMGGLVVAGWLALSQENRDKCSLFCSYACPYYGSLMALTMFEGIAGMGSLISDIADSLNSPVVTALIGGVKGSVDQILEEQAAPLLYGMTSIYQLLPTIELIQSLHLEEDESCVYLDNQPIRTREDLLAFYKSRFWCQDEEGNVNKAMTELSAYWDSLYVDVNGEKIHSTKLVNTHYFAGTGGNTDISTFYEDDEYVGTNDLTCVGDDTVPFYSATLNAPETAPNVYTVVATHIPLGAEFDKNLKPTVFPLIDSVLPKYAKDKLDIDD